MKNTIREWFNECSEPIRGMALKHAERYGTLDNEAIDFKTALEDAFSWEDTIEGEYFWNNIWWEGANNWDILSFTSHLTGCSTESLAKMYFDWKKKQNTNS